MKKPKFNAVTLRALLITLVLLLTAGLSGGFYYAQNWLDGMAVDINTRSAELATNDSTQAQANLQNQLNSLQPVELKASGILSSSTDFQNSVSADVTRYASSTGIEIESVSPSQLPVGATATNIPGVQTRYVKVTLKNPIPFNNLVKFIKAIETNLPKMKLTGISLTHSSTMGNSVTVDPLTLEVYTK